MNSTEEEDEVYDPFEQAIKRTGCWEQHLMSAGCIADYGDWRLCQKEVRFSYYSEFFKYYIFVAMFYLTADMVHS